NDRCPHGAIRAWTSLRRIRRVRSSRRPIRRLERLAVVVLCFVLLLNRRWLGGRDRTHASEVSWKVRGLRSYQALGVQEQHVARPVQFTCASNRAAVLWKDH